MLTLNVFPFVQSDVELAKRMDFLLVNQQHSDPNYSAFYLYISIPLSKSISHFFLDKKVGKKSSPPVPNGTFGRGCRKKEDPSLRSGSGQPKRKTSSIDNAKPS